jgi:hypothetical protein
MNNFNQQTGYPGTGIYPNGFYSPPNQPPPPPYPGLPQNSAYSGSQLGANSNGNTLQPNYIQPAFYPQQVQYPIYIGFVNHSRPFFNIGSHHHQHHHGHLQFHNRSGSRERHHHHSHHHHRHH